MPHRALAILTVAALGLGALAVIPGHTSPNVATAEVQKAKVTLASVSTPNPALLRRLDAEVAPPPPKAAAPAPVKVALASPVPTSPVPTPAVATGTDLTSTVAPTVDPTLTPASIGSSAVNLRAGPSSSAQQISVLQPGEAVQIGENSGGWVKVTRADGSTGWVYSAYLAGHARDTAPAGDQPIRVASDNQPRAVIRGDGGDLTDRTARIASRLPAYSRPNNGAQSLFTLQPGDEVYISEVRGSWIRIETGDGMTAWIRR